jgi:hypothetical protein
MARNAALACVAMASLTCIDAAAVTCTNENGHPVYTDRASDCATSGDKRGLATAPDRENEINFRTPKRTYQRIPGEWKIYVERDMASARPDLTDQATHKLQQTLSDILVRLPPQASNMIRGLNFYLMWGNTSPLGGMRSGLRTVLHGGANSLPLYDPAWDNAVVIYNAPFFLASEWAHKTLTHEIAHAWHLKQWPAKYAPILASWQHAKNIGLYRNVVDYRGKNVASAYALNNQMEYFAEISAIYFVGGHHFPFDRAGLKQYDPEGYRMVETVWNVH